MCSRNQLLTSSRKYKNPRGYLKKNTCAASELCRTEQREIVERAQENKWSLCAEYKSRWDIEESRRLGRILKQLKGTTKHEVDKVTININGTIQECTTQISMEQALFKEGTRRFSQSEREPPMHDAITSLVGFWGEKESASQILKGTFDTSSVQDKHLRLLMDHLRKPNSIIEAGEIPTTITLDEHIKEWRRQKEKTVSVSDTMDFWHHITATFNHHLAEMDRLLHQIPYKIGFSPLEYRNIVDYQILKKAGFYSIESIRTIQLMTAAFNLNNKRTSRLAMKRAEKYNLIPWEQAGSRKRRRAILSALDKVLTNDIARSKRLPCVIISCDAVSCYDRIVL